MTKGKYEVGRKRLPVVDQLTPTEARVYALFKEGRSTKEIGAALGMTANSAGRRLAEAKDKVLCSQACA